MMMNDHKSNRAKMPSVAALVDELREAGFSFRVVAAEDFETGHKAGSFDQPQAGESHRRIYKAPRKRR